MKYNPQIHHRKSIRLKGYDYSQAGLYFLTFCIKDRECLLGKIDAGTKPGVRPQMILNDAGIMINKWWEKIPEKFPDIELDVYQIMPNHFHAIIINTGIGNVGANPVGDDIVGADPRVCPIPEDKNTVGADPRVCPIPEDETIPPIPENENTVRADPRVCPIPEDKPIPPIPNENQLSQEGQTHGSAPTDPTVMTSESILGEHVGSPLHKVVQWFKTMSTNEYIRGVKTLGWPPFNGKLWQRNYYEHIIRNEQSYQNIADYIINNPANWKEDKFFKE